MSKHKRQRNKRVEQVSGLGLSDATAEPAITESTRTGPLAWINAHRIIAALIALGLFTITALGLKLLDDAAKSQKKLAAKDRSTLSSINPFMPAPLPTATPQLSKELI